MISLGASSDLRIATKIGPLGLYRGAGPRLEDPRLENNAHLQIYVCVVEQCDRVALGGGAGLRWTEIEVRMKI